MIKKITILLLVLSSYTPLSAQKAFITTWKTTIANESITIPTEGSGYNYTVDWGDGTTDTNQTGDVVHNYTQAGTYTVKITGDFPRIYFLKSTLENKSKIQSIEQWGDGIWSAMASAFSGCKNLRGNATDVPNLSNVTDMSLMFQGATSFNQDIGSWNVSNVTDMSAMFYDAASFNQDISGWSVSNVTLMSGMFFDATSFNEDLSGWDVSNVIDMSWMFREATSFNEDLSGWDVSNVTSMTSMFNGTASFNGNIGNWDVSNVTNMNSMFNGATSFNGDIGNWDVSNVIDMSFMFSGTASFNGDIGNWDVSNVMSMSFMFSGAASFNKDIGNWDVSNVINMTNMFENTGLYTENYDALLAGWSKRSLQNGVKFDAGSSKYCQGEPARQKLIDDFGWSITDGGKAAGCTLSTSGMETEAFRVWPNPTTQNIQIDFDGEIEQLSIYNLQGAEVLSQKGGSNKSVDVSVLSSGTYLLKIQTGAGSMVRRIVKK
ncbi:BspA family leucine-rich repeat surface protein [Flavivirga eckloniae]|uniref:BspA family leucine-rich repeat surface protein n=1 Tax=Flavivirga eckloniae TaxID=1803846 RepID=UPI001315A0F2|nr:BspA family leucine-rich repeat surface protein [Flavivirga eckloniae]